MLKYFNSRDELSAKAGGSLGEQGLRNKIELMQAPFQVRNSVLLPYKRAKWFDI